MVEVPEALRASPHTGSSTQWVPDRIPHQGSNKADALSTELQGHTFNSVACYHVKKRKQKEIARGGRSLLIDDRRSLGGACVFLGLGKHATTVQRIVDNLADGRSFRINVHSVARFQMSDNTLGRYLECDAVEFRIASRLNMIDLHKPLIQRQVCIKSHDCLHSSRLKNLALQCINYRCSTEPLGCSRHPETQPCCRG